MSGLPPLPALGGPTSGLPPLGGGGLPALPTLGGQPGLPPLGGGAALPGLPPLGGGATFSGLPALGAASGPGLPGLPALGGGAALPGLPALGGGTGTSPLPALGGGGSSPLPSLGGGGSSPLPGLPALGGPSALPGLPALGGSPSPLPGLPSLGGGAASPVAGLPGLPSLGAPATTGLPGLPALGGTAATTGLPGLPALGGGASTGLPPLGGPSAALQGLPPLGGGAPTVAIATPLPTVSSGLPPLGGGSAGLPGLPALGGSPAAASGLPPLGGGAATGLAGLPPMGGAGAGAAGLPGLPPIGGGLPPLGGAATGLSGLPPMGGAAAAGLPGLPPIGGAGAATGLPALQPMGSMQGKNVAQIAQVAPVARVAQIASVGPVAQARPVSINQPAVLPGLPPVAGPTALPGLPPVAGPAAALPSLPALGGKSTSDSVSASLPSAEAIGLPGLPPLKDAGRPQGRAAMAAYGLAADGTLEEPLPPADWNSLRQLPGAGEPTMVFTVTLLDPNIVASVVVGASATGEQLLINFAVEIQMFQWHFYHLSYKTPSGETMWVNPNEQLTAQGIDSRIALTVQLRYFKVPWRLVCPQALYIYFLQVKHAVLTQLWPVSSRLAIRLAALQLQVYEPDGHDKPSELCDKLVGVLPPKIVQKGDAAELRKRIRARWAKLFGWGIDRAAADYVKLCEQVPEFGTTIFHLTDEHATEKRYDLAIAENVIMLREPGKKWEVVPFEAITGWGYSGGASSMKITANLKHYMLKGTDITVDNVLSLLGGYYCLLASTQQLSHVDLPFPVSDFTDPRRYLPPRQLSRTGEIKHWSRLESFRQIYLTNCQAKKIQPIEPVMRQVDRALDAGTVWSRLDLSDMPIILDHLVVLFESLKSASDIVPEMAEVFEDNIQFHKVNLKGIPFSHRGLEPVGTLLSANGLGIRAISLSRCKLNAKACAALEHAFQQNRTLQIVDMSHNDLGEKGVRTVVKALKHNPNTRKFNFKDCQCTDKISPLIAQMIKANPVVTHFVLDRNAVRGSGLKHILTTLRASKTVRGLSLDRSFLDDASIKELMAWLVQKPLLRVLKISGNSLGSSAGKALNAYMAQPNALVSLAIGGNKFGSAHVATLLQQMVDNKSIIKFSIADTPIDKASAQPLCDMASRNNKIQQLDVAGCFGKDTTFQANFLRAVAGSPTVRKLNLSRNDMTKPDVYNELVQMIGRLSSLQELDLEECNIAPGLSQICTAVARTRLISLNVSKNKLTTFEPFSQLVSSSTSLLALHLRYTNITIAQVQDIVDAAGRGGTPGAASSSGSASSSSASSSSSSSGARREALLRLLDVSHNKLEKSPQIPALLASTVIRIRYVKMTER